jgi:excinuclease ABC subunit C
VNSQDLAKFSLPDSAGVYMFKKGRQVLYVGKATSLRDRVRSYFGPDLIATRGPLLVDMVFQADKVKCLKTDSVLEALILEADLIKKFQPKYNTKEKSDKSFNCVAITDEDFPQVLIVRNRELMSQKIEKVTSKIQAVYGPFPSSSQLRDALKIIRKIFPWRDSKCLRRQHSNILKNVGMLSGERGCFNYQLGLCPGVCVGAISKKEYGRTIRNLKLFFEGKKGALVKALEREMRAFAKRQEFEKALTIRKTIFALNHIQDVALLKNEDGRNTPSAPPTPQSGGGTGQAGADGVFRIEAYDIAHMSGKNMTGVMIVFEGSLPKKTDYRKFRIKGFVQSNDVGALREILNRRFGHSEWPLPSLIVIDGNDTQKRATEEILNSLNLEIDVVAVTKDGRHKPTRIIGNQKIVEQHKKSILEANAEAHRFAISYYRKLERQNLTRTSLKINRHG